MMGLFSKLFSKQPEPKVTVTVSQRPASQTASATTSKPAKLHSKGKPDSEGLYPGDIALLNIAETLKVGAERFPDLSYYGVPNPKKTLSNLQTKGYVEVGDAKGALPAMKVGELKEIAKALGAKQSGKKDDIIAAISEADDGRLNDLVSDRMWTLTESGKAAVARNAYVGFFMDNHPYDTWMIDFWTVSEACLSQPGRPYRDIIFHEFSGKKFQTSIEIQTSAASLARMKGMSPDVLRKKQQLDSLTEESCEYLRAMALFIEEEGSSYINAADYYFQYIFERINARAGLDMANEARLLQDKGRLRKDTLETILGSFYRDCQVFGMWEKELMRIKEEANISDDGFRDALITSFKRAEHSGFMTPEEAADFVILEVSGENGKAEQICRKAGKRSISAMGIKC